MTVPADRLARGIVDALDDITDPVFKFIERAAVTAALWWAGDRTGDTTIKGLSYICVVLLSLWAARQIGTRLPAHWTDPDGDHGQPLRAMAANFALAVSMLFLIISMMTLLTGVIQQLAPAEVATGH